MKKIIKFGSLLVLVMGIGLFSTAQMPPLPPSVWYSFDMALEASIGYVKGVRYSNSSVTFAPGRNTATMAAVLGTPDTNIGAIITATMGGSTTGVKLFGATSTGGNPATPLPDNFTISCWVYADPSDTDHVRKIFFAGYTYSRFALLFKGPDIYLRRTAVNGQGAIKEFDYLFGAPASFDAGEGWYQVILVMGRRPADRAKYCRLYVGKPGWVRYDASGPRVVSTTVAPDANSANKLATNFGGAYAFTGVQDFLNNEALPWGIGNANSEDPVHGGAIAPVHMIDDFVVWDVEFTDQNAFDLFECQRMNPANDCWYNDSERKRDTTQRLKPQPAATNDRSGLETITATSVFPNPTSGEVWIRIPAGNTGGLANITISDLGGKTLYTSTLVPGKTGKSIQLNMKAITKASGIFLLRVSDADQSQTFKIVVQ